MRTMKVPFTHAGDLLHYPKAPFRQEVVWRDNHTFTATMVIEDMRRGRSAAYFIMRDDEFEREYPIFMTDLLRLIRETTIYNGRVFATWTVVKRGQNYGLALA